ncbi:aspartyl/asparaginyl beta-hydroxylase domain-containing protein [Amycolatopsis sp. CA-126428]|uniref:aspartyl/asparaginyl beta-hydroxylase domain-containing protein n=1 Tax=Amycolatopsis sp. CA-126428 TaxID=2073158 RepID=UPI000CD21CB7|nr:aspartyl/asparaginyl beta-hydroxylase domain-containing protein [Amycolatopsis sp. CA-126428]
METQSLAYRQVLEPVSFGHPSAARLLPVFDPDRLSADVDELNRTQWALQRNFTTTGPGRWAAFDWRALPLRSPTGSVERTDPGGAGLDDFADTPWLEQAPYLAEVIRSVPAPLRTVRLLALGAGARSKVHFETKIGLPWANVRLHVPIITNPGASLMIDGVVHRWQPGSFWFGDFSRWHQVTNDGDRVRVHMIIDSFLTPELLKLFPQSFLDQLSGDDVLFIRPEVPLADLEPYRCAFDVPVAFTDWEEADGEFLLPQPRVRGAIEVRDGRLVLAVDGSPRFALTHVGDGEFRFAGWTEERTIHLLPGGTGVVLRTRQGASVRELAVPVEG